MVTSASHENQHGIDGSSFPQYILQTLQEHKRVPTNPGRGADETDLEPAKLYQQQMINQTHESPELAKLD